MLLCVNYPVSNNPAIKLETFSSETRKPVLSCNAGFSGPPTILWLPCYGFSNTLVGT